MANRGWGRKRVHHIAGKAAAAARPGGIFGGLPERNLSGVEPPRFTRPRAARPQGPQGFKGRGQGFQENQGTFQGKFQEDKAFARCPNLDLELHLPSAEFLGFMAQLQDQLRDIALAQKPLISPSRFLDNPQGNFKPGFLWQGHSAPNMQMPWSTDAWKSKESWQASCELQPMLDPPQLPPPQEARLPSMKYPSRAPTLDPSQLHSPMDPSQFRTSPDASQIWPPQDRQLRPVVPLPVPVSNLQSSMAQVDLGPSCTWMSPGEIFAQDRQLRQLALQDKPIGFQGVSQDVELALPRPWFGR